MSIINSILKYKYKIEYRYTKSTYKRAEVCKKLYNMKIGEKCEILPKVDFGSEPYLISLGNKVKIAGGVQFITHDGGINVLRNMNLLNNADVFGEIRVGNNVFIGFRSIIMPGVTIGDNVVIGGGSIVTRDIPNNSVVAGVPAKILSSIEDYYIKLEKKAVFTKNMKVQEKKNYLLERYNIKL